MIKAAIASLLVCIHAFAIEVKLVKEGSQIGFKVSEIGFPDNFEKSLKSGLTNVFIVKSSFWKNGVEIGSTQLSVKVIFDLWDEVYFVTRAYGSNENIEKIDKNLSILEKIKVFVFPSNIKFSEFKKSDTFEAKIVVILDPITKEKQKKIRKWLAENQVNIPGTSSRTPTSKTVTNNQNGAGVSAFETVKTSVFNQVLNSELDNDVIEGAWVYESEKIKLIGKDLDNAK